MIYYQRNIPQPNKSFSFVLNNFIGGLNNRSQEPALNQSPDMMNMRFTEDGFLEKRKGIKYFDEFNAGDEITYMDHYRPYVDEAKLIRATHTQLFFDETPFSIEGQVMGINHTGRYYYADTNNLYVYGKFDETASTYVEITGEQPTDYVSLKIVMPPDDYVPLPIEHVTGKTVYNFEAMTAHYEPCQNELEDTAKGPNVIPANPAYIINREGRAYVAGCTDSDDTVFISDVNKPLYFPNNLSLQLPPNSDKVKGLCLYNNTVLVGRENDMFVIRGETNNLELGNTLFTLQQLSAHTGLANQKTFISAHNYCFFLGSDKQFYIVRTLDTNSDALATTIISKELDISLYPISINLDDCHCASACFFKDTYYVAIGDKLLLYNYNHQAWTIYNNIKATHLLKHGTQLLIGRKDGRTVTESNTFLDLGIPYKAYWKSRYLDMGDASAFKFFREFFVVSRTDETLRSEVRFRFEIDYSDFDTGISVKNQIAIWGKALFGDRFINKNINATLPFQIGRRGRLLQVYYEGGYNVDGVVETLDELPNRPEGERNSICYYVTQENMYCLFTDDGWVQAEEIDLNQPMRIQQISGFYEMRGRRY